MPRPACLLAPFPSFDGEGIPMCTTGLYLRTKVYMENPKKHRLYNHEIKEFITLASAAFPKKDISNVSLLTTDLGLIFFRNKKAPDFNPGLLILADMLALSI